MYEQHSGSRKCSLTASSLQAPSFLKNGFSCGGRCFFPGNWYQRLEITCSTGYSLFLHMGKNYLRSLVKKPEFVVSFFYLFVFAVVASYNVFNLKKKNIFLCALRKLYGDKHLLLRYLKSLFKKWTSGSLSLKVGLYRSGAGGTKNW